MPRANRFFLPGHAWHITHRCHKKEFLLKFSCDRSRWTRWLYEARKRYGLSVLNFVATSNHIHLLVLDRGEQEIPPSMQLLAGRVAQEFNQRKGRKGAFWEDRYHATAVACDAHLVQCMTYIDLNMVRAGVVSHPEQWPHSGYSELMSARQRYNVIDTGALMHLLGVSQQDTLLSLRKEWVETALNNEGGRNQRELRWSSSLAVGDQEFVGQVKRALGRAGRYRDVEDAGPSFVLREDEAAYSVDSEGKMGPLRRYLTP